MLFGVVYFLLAGVLIANVWEAWRRVHKRSTLGFTRKVVTFLREVLPFRRPPHPGSRRATPE